MCVCVCVGLPSPTSRPQSPGGCVPNLHGGAALRDGEVEHDKGLGGLGGLAARLGAAGQAHAVQVVGLHGEAPRHHQHEVPLGQALHGGCGTRWHRLQARQRPRGTGR